MLQSTVMMPMTRSSRNSGDTSVADMTNQVDQTVAVRGWDDTVFVFSWNFSGGHSMSMTIMLGWEFSV